MATVKAADRVGEQRSGRRALLRLAAGAGVTVAGALVARGAPSAQAQTTGQQLTGSWFNIVQRVTGIPLINLITFHADGTVVVNSSDHPTRSGANGAWLRTGDRRFAYTYVRLLFTPDGVLNGYQRVRADATLNDTLDEFRFEGQADFWDAAGNLTMSNPTSGTAQLMGVVARTDPAPQTFPLG